MVSYVLSRGSWRDGGFLSSWTHSASPPGTSYIVYIYSIVYINVVVWCYDGAVSGAAAVGGMGKARPRGTAAVKTTFCPGSPRQNKRRIEKEFRIDEQFSIRLLATATATLNYFRHNPMPQ